MEVQSDPRRPFLHFVEIVFVVACLGGIGYAVYRVLKDKAENDQKNKNTTSPKPTTKPGGNKDGIIAPDESPAGWGVGIFVGGLLLSLVVVIVIVIWRRRRGGVVDNEEERFRALAQRTSSYRGNLRKNARAKLTVTNILSAKARDLFDEGKELDASARARAEAEFDRLAKLPRTGLKFVVGAEKALSPKVKKEAQAIVDGMTKEAKKAKPNYEKYQKKASAFVSRHGLEASYALKVRQATVAEGAI